LRFEERRERKGSGKSPHAPEGEGRTQKEDQKNTNAPCIREERKKPSRKGGGTNAKRVKIGDLLKRGEKEPAQGRADRRQHRKQKGAGVRGEGGAIGLPDEDLSNQRLKKGGDRRSSERKRRGKILKRKKKAK